MSIIGLHLFTRSQNILFLSVFLKLLLAEKEIDLTNHLQSVEKYLFPCNGIKANDIYR